MTSAKFMVDFVCAKLLAQWDALSLIVDLVSAKYNEMI